MRFGIFVCALFLISCGKQEGKEQKSVSTNDEARIEALVSQFYKGMDRAYNAGGISSDSLIDASYDKDALYITPWGWTEPLDSTKARLRNAFGHVKNYSYRLEGLKVKTFGTAGYAFFILRQQYVVNGDPLDEYLPTTFVLERKGSDWKIIHTHRSTDYETVQQYVALQQRAARKK